MKIHKSTISVALFLVTTASLASDPPAPAAAASPQAPVAATPAQAPAAATTSAAPIGPKVAATTDAAATAKAAHALGYSPKQRNGKTVYCKPEAALGTRLQSMSCYSEEEITAVVRRSIENQDSLARIQKTELYQEGKQ